MNLDAVFAEEEEMRFSPPDDDIELYETGFDNDFLGRKKVSERISSIIERIEDPLVIALDGRWGTGKTFFLKRWVGAHSKENGGKATTVYFDAFANDYMGEPLIALISALASRLPPKSESKLDRVKEVAAKLWRPAIRIGLALGTAGVSEALNDVADAGVKALGSETEKTLEQFWKKEEGRQAAFVEFRSAIEELTLSDGDAVPVPLVIVIDELDRCRPDYALETLEVIKHFFAVPHVHFILGVNLSALENSVKARYGAEIDATGYLQKFLSFTINLPNDVGDHIRTPVILKYVRHLAPQMGTPQHLLAEIEQQIKYVSHNNPVSIRQIGRILSSVSLMSEFALKDNTLSGWRMVMATLLIARVTHPELFTKFVASNISKKEIEDFFGIEEKSLNQNNSSDSTNPEFNWTLKFTYASWLLITNNHESVDKDYISRISGAFSNLGILHEIGKIPQTIYDSHL